MAKSRDQKKDMVLMYRDKLKQAKAVYIVESQKIKASEASEIKKNLYDLKSSYNVVKNRLFTLALKEEGFEVPEGLKEGQHAIIFANENTISESAKVLNSFLEQKKKEDKLELSFVGGILDKKTISKADVVALANLPGREQLLTQVLGTMNAPISGFVRTAAGTLSNFMNVLNALKDKKTV